MEEKKEEPCPGLLKDYKFTNIYLFIFVGVFESVAARNILWPNSNFCRDPDFPQFYVNVGSYYKQIWNVIMNDYETDGPECQLPNGVDVEDTAKILKSLLASQGPDYLENVFGPKARNNMEQLGGVDKVARALHGKFQFIKFKMFQPFFLESATIDDFGDQMSINVDILRSLLIAVDTGDVGTIKSHGIGVDSSEEKDLVSRYAILFIYFYFILM